MTERKTERRVAVGKEYTAKPFTANRVCQILSNPFYAGMQPLNGELFEVDVPTYVDVETFERLKAERSERSNATGRKVGRPVEGYLLAELARCGLCGAPLQAQTDRKPRKRDGTRGRRYVCRSHREHHKDSEHFCALMPLDATQVDRMVLANLDVLLADETSALEQLAAGQRDERAKFERAAEAARVEAEAADRAAERATAEFADAVDADERALLKDAAKRKRADAERARTRMDAALDALALHEDEPQADLAHVLGRMWSALSGDIAGAGDDVKALNAILRENFERVELVSERTCKVVVSPAAIQRHMRDDGRCVLPVPPELTLTVGAGGAERPRFFS
jgi:hypothetical protein